jgi:predicted dehydrogenase
VGHIERYNRALRAAEPYLDGPRYIESQRLAPFQPRGTDVAVVLDLMIHDLDLVLYLTGGQESTEVRASGLSVLSSHLDIANAWVEFANGAVALATASRVSRDRVRKLRLFQPNGYLSPTSRAVAASSCGSDRIGSREPGPSFPTWSSGGARCA